MDGFSFYPARAASLERGFARPANQTTCDGKSVLGKSHGFAPAKVQLNALGQFGPIDYLLWDKLPKGLPADLNVKFWRRFIAKYVSQQVLHLTRSN